MITKNKNDFYYSVRLEETGLNIYKLINKSGKKIRELKDLLGFNNPTIIYYWMNGIKLPNLENALKLSKILNCKIEDIYCFEKIDRINTRDRR